ncbi:MAG: NAD(P)H-hydrate epimerase, partial [Saprospiraceae bacterium]
MKILNPSQIRQLDHYTIENEPISSLDLMERAALSFVEWFENKYPVETDPLIKIVSGTGNNGGDGLAIARLLYQRFYRVELFLCAISTNVSEDFSANLARLPKRNAIPNYTIEKDAILPDLNGDIIIDAIFGSGLNRPVVGYWAQVITQINNSSATRISVDIPSGVFANQHTKSTAVEADETFSFQLPKLAFLFPENFNKVKKWTIGDIKLAADGIDKSPTKDYYITAELTKKFLQTRSKFAHKGTHGHALLIAGSYGKMGAAILAAKASLRAGCGLLSVHIPRCGYEIMQIAFPEAMAQVDRHKRVFSRPPKLSNYQAIGVGPGLGTNKITVEAMEELLDAAKVPLVIDADGLNILSKHPQLLQKIPTNSILTPHPKEFERL